MGKAKRVVVFSGGRGATTIIRALTQAGHHVSVVVNGYDDGLSTGLIRRIVPEMQGPSDFRKLCENLGDIAFMDGRGTVREALDKVWCNPPTAAHLALEHRIASLGPDVFDAPMAFGNMWFAYNFLKVYDFQDLVDKFRAETCTKVDIFSVSANAGALTALTHDNGVMRGEADIVDSTSKVVSIYITPPAQPASEAVNALEQADVIIYGPGTFPSSIWPSIAVLRKTLNHVRVPSFLMTNSVIDGGMNGWSLLDYVRVFRDLDIPRPVVLHDRRSVIQTEMREGLQSVIVFYARFLNDAAPQLHDGAFVAAFIDTCVEKGWHKC